MPSPNGLYCVQKLDHCEGASLENQPQGLTGNGDLWQCDNCEQGFYFDGVICDECQINNCIDCSNATACTKCEDGFGLSSLTHRCIEYIENCRVPFAAQPDHLIMQGQIYSCPSCIEGFFTGTDGKC